MSTENITPAKFVLKKSFIVLPEQRRKILQMPLKGFVANLNQNTNEMKIPVDLLNNNQQELVDYLICLICEKADGTQVDEQELCNISTEDYNNLKNLVKEVNPFGVFDIKAV
jgi:hypothetical protein